MAVKWQRDYRFYQTYMRTLARLYNDRRDIRSYLELTLSLLAIIIFSLFAIRPTIITIGSLLKEIEAKNEVITQMDQKIVSLTQAQTAYEEHINDFVFLDQAAPEETKPLLYVRQIEGIAQQAGVELQYYTSDDPIDVLSATDNQESEQLSAPIAFKLTINVKGEYENLYQFLNLLENLRQPFVIDDLSIVENSEEPNLLYMYMSGYTYYFTKLNTQ